MSFETDLIAAIPVLRLYAIKLTRSRIDCEDLIQDTCVKALRVKHRYVDEGRFGNWLRTIMHNVHFNRLRRMDAAPHAEINLDFMCIEMRDAEAILFGRQVIARMGDLSTERREVLGRATIGETCGEIARAMDTAIGTVKSRTNRARADLALALEGAL